MELHQQVTPIRRATSLLWKAGTRGESPPHSAAFTAGARKTCRRQRLFLLAYRPRSRPGSRGQGCGASCAGRRAVHLAEKTQQLVQGQNMCCVAQTTFLPELRTQAASCGSGGSRPSPWQPTWSRRMRKTDSSSIWRNQTALGLGDLSTHHRLWWTLTAPTLLVN